MYNVHARNVNDALVHGVALINAVGVKRQSRNGPVISVPAPVVTTYTHPQERVLFSRKRNANPFFHLMESLWMLAGRNDTEFLTRFVKRMAEFSDDGKTLFGAYGMRWRHHFGYDQLEWAIDELRTNPMSRRVVVAMWNAKGRHEYEKDMLVPSAVPDLWMATHGGKDVPCNTHIYFTAHSGRLDMTVCNRSNDAIWGCYGANAVHMSFLQEYVAAHVGIPVGTYYQFSNDLHIYTDQHPDTDYGNDHFYRSAGEDPVITPLRSGYENASWIDKDIHRFFSVVADEKADPRMAQYQTAFFAGTVAPMYAAWMQRKALGAAMLTVEQIQGADWQRACTIWLETNRGGKK